MELSYETWILIHVNLNFKGKMPTFDRPLMITCTGRSGSTVFYRILARHRDVGFLSTLNQQFPTQPWLAMFSRMYSMQIFNGVRDHRLFPKPFSPYNFWQQYLPEITRHDRPLVPDDVPKASIEPLRQTVANILKLQGKKRFLMKVTGWSRMAYFECVFPGLRFIYLKRLPRDVVSSWIQAGWLNVTATPDSDSWEWGKIPHEYIKVWREMGKKPILAAAIKTQLDIDDIRQNMALFPGRCTELNYEDFVKDPVPILREVLKFCELEWYPEFEQIIKRTEIYNFADKWKKFMTEEEGELIAEFYARINRANHADRAKSPQPVYQPA